MSKERNKIKNKSNKKQCLKYHHLKSSKITTMYTRRDCMKKFCESLREHAMKIISFKEKK